ncbi:Uncharacterised protein [Mycobacteroides abscessus subsp. massiliense]|uniref:hypothetical protein n=1 Tax=Mycobacteroides abscessus TaxID=36809 RepID=UPI0009A7ADAF|nr:hypothetical protein [Mycobacteroides abscessus]SKT55607.1 Uncharacterised protein [Mycobacteroides abscessus subsp. massiliense]
MPLFRRFVTLHRFVHAADADTAHSIAHHGMQLGGNKISERFAIVEAVIIEGTAVYPYLHAGEDDDLWQVSITVGAQLRTADPLAATEAAYQLVMVDPEAARGDAFEFEIKVHGSDEQPMRKAG